MAETSKLKKTIRYFNDEFIAKGRIDLAEELIDTAFINQTATNPFSPDRQGMIQFVQMLHGGFSNIKVEILEQLEEGDIVASRKVISATHTGILMGKAPTGKEVKIMIMDFVRIKDGKYLEHWGQSNFPMVLQQL